MKDEVLKPGISAYLAVTGHALAATIFLTMNLWLPNPDVLSWTILGGIGALFLGSAYMSVLTVRKSSIVVGADSVVIITRGKERRIRREDIERLLVAYGHVVIVHSNSRRIVIPCMYKEMPKLLSLLQQIRPNKAPEPTPGLVTPRALE